MTPPKKEVLKSKLCCYCKVEKPVSDFYVMKNLPSGYDARCKVCRKNNCKCRKAKSYERSRNLSSGRPRTDLPQLYNVTKQDWIETFEFLKRIGYDLNRNIHEQFCERNNLQPAKRMYEKSIQYTAKDLGMI